jgi:hypothetical protein
MSDREQPFDADIAYAVKWAENEVFHFGHHNNPMSVIAAVLLYFKEQCEEAQEAR